MQYIVAAVLALAASAVAAPPQQKRESCAFGTYRCTGDISGIEVCAIDGSWELVGPCPTGTACENLPQNGFDLPFCTNSPATAGYSAPAKRDYDGGYCTTPGRYYCLGTGSIQVCDTQNKLELVGDCPKNSHCSNINGIPFCIDN